MKWRNTTPLHWLIVAFAGLMALTLASFGIGRPDVARASGSDGDACYKVEDPTGTVFVNHDGIILTLQIGTYPDVAEPNTDNAITSVQLDPASVVTSGTIIVKGGPRLATYSLGTAPPLHAPPLTSNGKWPTISYVAVCAGEPTYGWVQVTKVVDGTGAPEQEFTISLTPNGGTAITQSIIADETATFEGLTPGVYTLSETDPGDNWSVTYSDTSIDVVAGQTSTATVTNTYTPAPLPGRVEVTKVVDGSGAPAQVFTISLTPAGGAAITKTITAGQTVAFEGLNPGVYTLSEADPGTGWTAAYSSSSITVVAGQTSTATVTNTYVSQLGPTPVGSVIVAKLVAGDPPSATYDIGLVGPAPATTERWRTITGAGEVTFSAIPLGTYTVVERDPGGNYTVTISPKTITVTNGDVARATVTNTYEVVESSAGTLPPTGSADGPAIAAAGLALIVGGTALAALSRRRKMT